MSDGNGSVVSVKILPNDSGTPKGKLADAEVIFGADCGPFQGLRLLGFGIWKRTDGGKNVTLPARKFTSTDGRDRSFLLLRSVDGEEGAYKAIRQTILDAYTRTEQPAS
jgi:hypothetical protein